MRRDVSVLYLTLTHSLNLGLRIKIKRKMMTKKFSGARTTSSH